MSPASLAGVIAAGGGAILFVIVPLLAQVLPPGLPAVVALPLALLLGIAAGRAAAPGLPARPRVTAFATGVTASVFWAWAAWKVYTTGDRDLGALSFLLVIVASSITFRTSGDFASSAADRPFSSSAARVATLQQLMAVATGAVAANFVYVLLVAPVPASFQFYCVLGALFWVAAGVANWMSLRELATNLTATQEEARLTLGSCGGV